MRFLRVAALSITLTLVAGIAFAPQFLFADLQTIVTKYLADTTIFSGGTAGQTVNLVNNTVSGADSAIMCIGGGGACLEARGARIQLYGKDDGGQVGALTFATSTGNGTLQFRTNGSGRFTYDVAGNVIQQTAGGTYVQAPYTATAAATPAASTNFCNGNCVVPTAAANAAVFIGAGTTPTPGAQISIYNSNGTNLIRAKAVGASTINGSVAGGYIGLSANTSMSCIQASATDLVCNGYSGGAMPTPAGP
jgi:hypothetical protein